MAPLILRALVLTGLLGFCGAVSAEPVTAAIAAWWAAATVAQIAMVALYVVSVANTIYGSIQTKKRAKAAAQRAAEQEAANLRDRTALIIQAESPFVTIYGSPAPVGGTVPAVFTSGQHEQFSHFIFLIASHECAGVDAIYIGGEHVGNLDPQGYADGANFQLDEGVRRLEIKEFELAEFSRETEGGTEIYPDGYWILPLRLDVDGFDLQGITDLNGNPLTGVVLGQLPNSFGGRALVGQKGVKGRVSYWVNGPGAALNVQIHTSPGGVDTADAFFRAARPDLWTEAHKFSGYTYLAVTVNKLLERFQGGIPEITVKVRGKPVYDFRTGTIAYSRNNALCLADFIQSEVGYGAALEHINVEDVISSANICDTFVYAAADVDADPASYGGSRARYLCDGMFRSDQDRDATRQQIEDSMAGFSLESGGVWRILAGAWTTPVMALTDDDMIAPSSVVQTANPGTARYNGVRGTYVNATRNGVTEDFTPYFNTTFLDLDEKEKVRDLVLSFTGDHVRTQQLARVVVEQSRGGFVLQIHPSRKAWHLQPGDRIVLSDRLNGFENKPFRVQDWTYSPASPLSLQVVEDEESFYDLADETRADPSPNTSLPSPFIKPGPPLDLVAISGESQMVQQDGVMVVRVHVSWAQSPDAMVLQAGTTRLQWRLADGGLAWQTVDLPGDATEFYLLGLEVHNAYVIRVQFLTAYASSNWSVIQHEVHGLEGPPDSVLGLRVEPELTGIFAYWQEPEGIDLLGWSATQLRRGPSWELAEGNILFDGRAASANLGWFPAGSQAVWAAHHNTIDQWSEPVFKTIEIEPPAQSDPHGTVNNRNTVALLWQDCKTTQPIAHYEIRIGETWETSTVVTQILALSWSGVQPKFGEHRYWVTAVDVAGNRGAPGYTYAVTLGSLDSVIGNLRGVVQASLDEIAALQAQGLLFADKQFVAVHSKVNQNQAVVSSQLSTFADEQGALASRVDIVAAITDLNTAAIVDEREARTTQYSAMASLITTVQSSVGSLSATVEVQSNTLASLNGNVAAQHMIRTEVITALGKRAMAGLSLGVSSSGGGAATQSEAIVFADRFYVVADVNATALDAPFRVEGGIVFINVAKIKDADIGTLKVAGFALGISLSADGLSAAGVSFTVPAGQVWRASALAVGGNSDELPEARFEAQLSVTGASAIARARSTITREGAGTEGGASYLFQSPTLCNGSLVDYGPGTHSILATWGTSPVISTSAPVILMVEIQKRGA
ncbi:MULTISPECIES: DUF1983 domain-containing protein [unclassified Variovorax]|uniref:phage tail tip fiber protein n=1 Tax=unclassified Variovorax TaxID=663243 RepID=UPI002576C5A8|nr:MULTISPECIES: DUF1983 domain-containing protein [unclassified Variovorax]MDM0086746.1 DUF1983 domain-containing protein [Variovorax sp. J22G40]MDM0144998.1 DUF1983 domain-containing protein [Variovorax sp. J2P1-31]